MFYCYIHVYVSPITDKNLIELDFIWVSRRVSYKKQVLLTLREHLNSPPDFGGICVAHLLNVCFVCFVLCPVCLMLQVSLNCPLLIGHVQHYIEIVKKRWRTICRFTRRRNKIVIWVAVINLMVKNVISRTSYLCYKNCWIIVIKT